MNFNPGGGSPFGRSPDGNWIVSADELPELPMPRRVRVTNEFLEIDDWVFPLSFVTKSLLIWLQASFYRWADEDESKRNREWLEGIFEAFQDGLAGNL
jgi:hypothetical protein